MYLNPFIMDSHLNDPLTYDEVFALHKEKGVHFRGTSSLDELYNIEFWEDECCDGHTDWVHQGSYLVKIRAFGGTVLKYLNEMKGYEFQLKMHDAVDSWERVNKVGRYAESWQACREG
jgi:hypothetical protein